ncbi:hypothetical protein F5B20DRAFT_584844 [Whalleya microplaca]|nr:hypothetical protein F5B20DRAFT_584844 [Whalleya microplaca]
MDTLWRTHQFKDGDFNKFKYFDQNAHKRQHSRALYATWTASDGDDWLQDKDIKTGADLDDWKSSNADVSDNMIPHHQLFQLNSISQGFDVASTSSSFAFLLCPQAAHKDASYPTDRPGILEFLPFCKSRFKVVAESLQLHRGLVEIIQRKSPSCTQIESKINGAKATVYILRSQDTLSRKMALAMTYIAEDRPRHGAKLYGLFLGVPPEYATVLASELQSSKSAAFLPFTMIKLFLQRERRNRLDEVDDAVKVFTAALTKFAGPQTAAPARDNPGEMIDMYLKVSLLKGGLLAWKTQLERMKSWTGGFTAMAGGNDDIKPGVYLERLIDDYDIRINDCETVMQGASLAFQLETTLQAREDTRIAIKDGKAMKTVAVVTMFFLPGTFFATLLAVPEFEPLKTIAQIPPWSVYLIMFIPSTAFLMTGYFYWIQKKSQGAQFLPT